MTQDLVKWGAHGHVGPQSRGDCPVIGCRWVWWSCWCDMWHVLSREAQKGFASKKGVHWLYQDIQP